MKARVKDVFENKRIREKQITQTILSWNQAGSSMSPPLKRKDKSQRNGNGRERQRTEKDKLWCQCGYEGKQ